LLTNASGTIYSLALPPGTLTPNSGGNSFKYTNPDAKIHGGVFKAMIRVRDLTEYRYTIQAYGDLSAATDPLMSIQFYLGDQPTPAFLTATWTPKKFGWKLVQH